MIGFLVGSFSAAFNVVVYVAYQNPINLGAAIFCAFCAIFCAVFSV